MRLTLKITSADSVKVGAAIARLIPRVMALGEADETFGYVYGDTRDERLGEWSIDDDSPISATLIWEMDTENVPGRYAAAAREHGLTVLGERVDGMCSVICVRGPRCEVGDYVRGYFNWSISDEGLEDFAPFDPSDLEAPVSLAAEPTPEQMTLDAFRASRREVANLEDELCGVQGPGYVYANHFYIEIVDGPSGRAYQTTIMRNWHEGTLSGLEEMLYEYAIEEELLITATDMTAR